MTKLLGRVDALGLDTMGRPAGLHPTWGIMIGGGLSSLTAMGVSRTSGSLAKHADLIGFLAGSAVGGALYFAGDKTKGAGLSAIATSFVTSGLKWLEHILFGPSAGSVQKAVSGMGLPTIQALNGGGLGLPTIQALNGGLGLPSMSNTPRPHGTIPGVAGIQVDGTGMGAPPVSLLGQRASTNGPTISGLSAAYGATLLGRG